MRTISRMPFAEPYVYLRAVGVFGASASSPVDIWSAGFKFRHPEAAPSTASLQAFLETASVPVSNFHASAVRAGTNCFLTELTAAFVGTDGRYVGGSTQSTVRRPYTTPTPGIGTTDSPYSQALVLSLRTAILRGPGSNGRVYWPATSLTIDGATGTLTTTQLNGIITPAKVLIDNLNAAKQSAMPGTGPLAVMSAVGTGIAATVTSVRIGRRLDTQERRENKIPEAYVSASIAAGLAQTERNGRLPIGEPREL